MQVEPAQFGPKLLSVVAPCYNEEHSIAEFHRRVSAACATQSGDAYEIVLVNDGSTDATLPALQALAESDPHVVVIDLARNYGHQIALSAGLELCRGDRILILDADLLFDDATFELFNFPRSQWPYDVALAHAVGHEAAHSFGILHTADQGLISDSDIIKGGVGPNLENISFFNRFPLADQINPAINRNIYDELAANVGLRPGAPEYVTGTGAFDRIIISPTGFGSAQD